MGTPTWLIPLIEKAFPHRSKLARMTKAPIVAEVLHQTIFNGDDMIYLPKDQVVVQQSIEQPGSVLLPSALVDHFIEKASYRWIMNFCICREGDNCQDYPHDLGCVFLGDAVLNISSKIGHLASKEETLAHVRRARELGLVHLIGRDRIDNLWTGAYPFGKLMTICQCCPCCCLFKMLPKLDPVNRSKVVRMPGVKVWVDSQECIACGTCAQDVCFVGAIQMTAENAQISEECRGCGRCVEACPQEAIHLTIEDSDFLQKQITRITNLVDVTKTVRAPRWGLKGTVEE
ncbi:MAG: 4Fe-4S binding protein [Anaerolineaceae bacterium]|nr:4Fe-4S binding protein [Anaerolineaceae bacterium]